MNKASDAPKRPALKWHGGKWRLAKWILSYMPHDHEVYIEPFGGAASILLNKPRSLIEVYNDLDSKLINFFQVLREQPTELIRAIEMTPYSRREWQHSISPCPERHNPVDYARLFYVNCMMSITSANASWSNGWRRQKKYSRGRSGRSSMKPAPLSFMEISHLYTIAHRFRGVFIESISASQIIEDYDQPEALFYLDPPYLGSTRQRKNASAYAHEMVSTEDHLVYLNEIAYLQGMALISGYDNPLYDNELIPKGWQRVNKPSRTNGDGQRIESLWLNPNLLARLSKEGIDV